MDLRGRRDVQRYDKGETMKIMKIAMTVIGLGTTVAFMGMVEAATYCADQLADGAGNPADCPADGSCAGTCSLRDAVLAANAHGGADEIRLKAGTYTIAGTTADRGEDAAAKGDFDITDDVVIEGAGVKATVVDADHIDRIFDIRGLHTVSIRKLKLINGEPGAQGGGISSLGRLTVQDASIEDCTAVNNGGGVAVDNAGTLTVERSLVFHNKAANGGGIGCEGLGGDIDVENVTLSQNEATGKGGGISCAGLNDVRLANATVVGNIADRDGNGGVGSSEDGGGIWTPGGLIRNTVFYGNVDGSTAGDVSPDCATDAGGWYLAGSGYNFVSKKDGCFTFGAFNRTGDLTGTIAAPLDPKLGPLGDRGGSIKTYALSTGSPLLNAGDPAGCLDLSGSAFTVDARGFDRPVGAACDIGAFEQGDCGDGFLDVGEVCDDGNVTDGDGCSSACTAEEPEEPATTGDGTTGGGTAGDTTTGGTSGDTAGEEPVEAASGGCSLIR